jgi:pyruvate/2-oxoglutarate dehydrogenase complex dihydrolipoamide dehydrogenase (E3) component
VEFDELRVVDSDGILALERVPDTMVVVGAGVIGIEYASMFAALGTRVTVVEKRDTMLEFCDPEVVESLKFHLRDLSVTFRFGEEVEKVEVGRQGTVTTLASGKRIAAETVMYSAGRQGMTGELGLDAAGLSADPRGRITVDEEYRTSVPHIFAVGDVIGFPALAATSMDQGRLAALYAFGEPATKLQDIQPIGIYTIPEISYCGRTEVALTADSVPYEVGVSRYRELARGQIVGDSYGMLKLLVSTATRHLLGVHVFGTGATDLVHIGQAVMGCGGTVDYLVDTVFNYRHCPRRTKSQPSTPATSCARSTGSGCECQLPGGSMPGSAVVRPVQSADRTAVSTRARAAVSRNAASSAAETRSAYSGASRSSSSPASRRAARSSRTGNGTAYAGRAATGSASRVRMCSARTSRRVRCAS